MPAPTAEPGSSPNEPRREISPAQEEAIRHPATRLQVVASAGAGKTEVLARRAVWLLTGKHLPPDSILAFTFTEKAAAELRERIEERAAEADPAFAALPPVSRGMFIGTTHSWALEALRELGGIYETVDVLDEASEWSLLQRVARRIGLVELYAEAEGRETARVALAPAVERFLRSAEVVYNERIARDRLAAAAPRFAAVLERYDRLLLDMRLLPFRMLLDRAADALAPGGPLWSRLRGRLRHVLVDEAQDFNRAQEEILRRLMELGAAVTLVGDDDQAIYQWRGGDVEIFTGFQEAERVHLTTNYRSRPEIIRLASAVVEGLPSRLPKELRADRPPSPPGAVEFFVAATPSSEAEEIARRVDLLLAEGQSPGEVAILLRSVRTAAQPIVAALRRHGVRVSVVGRTSLMARPEMALIARIFIFWSTAGSEPASWWPDPYGDRETVTVESLTRDIVDVTGAGKDEATRLVERILRLGEQLRSRGVDDVVALYDRLLSALGLPRAGRAHEEMGLGQMSSLLTSFERSLRRAAPAWLYQEAAFPAAREESEEEDRLFPEAPPASALASSAGAATSASLPSPAGATFTAAATPGEIFLTRLKAFLEAFAGRAVEEPSDAVVVESDAVQILTVHQAKGLEFPVVFVPSLVEGRFPSSMTGRRQLWYVPETLFDRPRYEGREEDEARLFYVALSRARELLVLSAFENHEKGGRAGLSRFLAGGFARRLDELARPSRSLHPPVLLLKQEKKLLVVDFTSLLLYESCGYRYWLSRLCGFQPLLARELGFGRLLHHVVAELSRRAMAGRIPEPADVEAILAKSFYLPFAGSVSREKLLHSAARRLTRYVRKFGGELARVVQPEMRFEVPVAGARIRGRVDLLLRAEPGAADADPDPDPAGRREVPGEEVVLVDFKTSENRPPLEAHQNQLRLYALACRRLGYKPAALYIHDLDADDGGRIEVPEDDASRESFARHVEGLVEGIRSARFEPNPAPATCRGCDLRTFCPYSAVRMDAA
ncbi:MAG: ATP-dependent helicase [Chloroflexi bacterium]|nr:ATP-dependent helicase [Chloroflexota bacterium]